MRTQDLTDIRFTDDGDLYIGLDNDLNIVNGQNSMEQAVIMRLKTEIEDCALWPNFGHNIREMKGKRFIKSNIDKLKQIIYNALSQGDLFNQITIEILPTVNTEVLIYCGLLTQDYVKYKLSFQYNFDSSYMNEIVLEKL